MKKQSPMLYQGDMVRAIKDGRKTNTRRVMREQPDFDDGSWRWTGEHWEKYLGYPVGHDVPRSKRYGGVGDLIYVRETFWAYGHWYQTAKKGKNGKYKWSFKDVTRSLGHEYVFDADDHDLVKLDRRDIGYHKRSSIFLPKFASRIWLEITDLRVERLHDMKWSEAQAEGVLCPIDGIDCQPPVCEARFGEFARLWNRINGQRHPWASNPAVWSIHFKKTENPNVAKGRCSL